MKKPDGRDTADQQNEEVEHVSPSSDAKSFEPLSTVQRPQSTAPPAVQQDKDAGILVSRVFSLLFTLCLFQSNFTGLPRQGSVLPRAAPSPTVAAAARVV